MKKGLADFVSGYATEDDTAAAIAGLYDRTGYVIDPHTAVGDSVYRRYAKESGDATKTVIASTASPFKFARSVMSAIEGKKSNEPDMELIERLSKTANMALPPAIIELKTAPVRHDTVCETEEMPAVVRKILAK